MTLAMLTTLGPAIVRLPIGFIEKGYIAATIAVDIALILVCIIVDAVRNRRLHPAFGWGGLLTIGSIFVFVPVCPSETWASWCDGCCRPESPLTSATVESYRATEARMGHPQVYFDLAFPRRCSLSRTMALRSAAGRISHGPNLTPGCFDINSMA